MAFHLYKDINKSEVELAFQLNQSGDLAVIHEHYNQDGFIFLRLGAAVLPKQEVWCRHADEPN